MAPSETNPSGDATAIQVLAEYYRAFSTLEVEKIFPYFHEPATLISPLGVFVAPTPSAVAAVLSPAMENLKRRRYGHSELSARQVKALSEKTTIVIGVAIRYTVEGLELDRAGVTYLMQKTDSGWKIAVLILHDPED